MNNMDCPICKVEAEDTDNGDFKCPNCKRRWYKNESGDIMSRKRKVNMKKVPEEGDNINDVVESADESDLDYDVSEVIDGNKSDGVMEEAMSIYQEWLDWCIKKAVTKEAYKKKGRQLEADLRKKNCEVKRNKMVKPNGDEILTARFIQDGVENSDLRILIEYSQDD